MASSSLLLLVSILLIHIPSIIYSGSPAEFHYPLGRVLALGATVAIGVVALLAAPAFLAKGRALEIYACFWFAASLYVWGSTQFLVPAIELDGRASNIPITSAQRGAAWLLLLLALAAAYFASRRPKVATIFSVVLHLGLGGLTMRDLARADAKPLPSAAEMRHLYRFSPEQNALIVLFDTFQSDIFWEILEQHPEWKRELSGFTLYRNTLGVSPTTFVAMPSILSGEQFSLATPPSEQYENRVRNGSFLSQLTNAGYEGSMINPPSGVCPRGLDLCVPGPVALRSSGDDLKYELVRLVDLALLRAAPPFAKNWLFNGGIGRLQAEVSAETALHQVRGNRIVRTLANRMTVEPGPPTAKFIHVYNTHPPVVLDGECAVLSEPLPGSRENFRAFASCAVEALVDLMAALKRRDLYERSLIVFMSDHGTGLESEYVPSEQDWSWMAGAANPTFAVKAPGAEGPLQVSDRALQLTDVPKTVFDGLGEDALAESESGYSALAETNPDRLRIFNSYVWRTTYVEDDEIPGVARFQVRGPLWERSSWNKAGAAEYSIGDQIQFQMPHEDAVGYLGLNWGAPTPLGRVAFMGKSTLDLLVPVRPQGTTRLEADVEGVFGKDLSGLQASIQTRGRSLGTWELNPLSGRRIWDVSIPADAWDVDGGLLLTFVVRPAAGPQADGADRIEGDGSGLRFRWLRIDDGGAHTSRFSTDGLRFSDADPPESFGSGWLGVELLGGKSDQTFRWALGSRAELFVALPRGPSRLFFVVGTHLGNENQVMSVSVDGAQVGSSGVKMDQLQRVGPFLIPADEDRPNVSRIDLTFSESNTPLNGDLRQLSVLFEDLVVEPAAE
jgi:hypothetical protein